MKRDNKVFRDTAPMLEERFGKETALKVLELAREHLLALLEKNADEPKAVKAHTAAEIYPCISLYVSLMQVGIPRPQALAFMDFSCSRRAEPKAESMRAMMKLPGAYKLMPRIFKWVAKNQFGAQAGFAATYYDTDKSVCKFDMTRCLFCDVCRKNGCPELVPCFCHTDDVTNGNIHPKLRWHRTTIMGDGGKLCDFDLRVTEK